MGTICADIGVEPAQQEGTIQSRSFVSRMEGLCFVVIAWIIDREDKRLSRIALSELTDDQLADIGVTPAEARREAARPVWN
jgi:uncharacterized protein YjiS (DUF1127 family)